MRDVTLSVATMTCRHRVREVTAWLRDVPGVEQIAADATTGVVVVSGTMTAGDVLGVLGGSPYVAHVLQDVVRSPAS